LNHICNIEASDTISMGGTIAFAIECYENGILTKEDTNGLELTWGNSEAISALCKKIINREGIGDILADGVKIASEKIGKGSEKYAIHSLGSELPMHNPRFTNSLAFSYAYDPTPGKHNTASVDMADIGPINKFHEGFTLPKNWKKDEKQRVKAQILITGIYQPLQCSGLCIFATLLGRYPLLELINSLTGWNMDLDEVLKSGFRIQALRQAFTLREGVDIANNELSGRIIGDPPDEVGPMKGRTIEYKEDYQNYCREMGWNPENGYPLEETLKDLDLEFVIKDLY
jgi:aldehyde:ferredoxin oxidoreductase